MTRREGENRTAGVEPCQAGWISVTFDNGRQGYHILRTEEELASLFEETDRIYVDVPIGLSTESFSRECEELLKKRLGDDFAEHIVHAPIRPVLEAPSYVEASMQSLEYTGLELSPHSWKLTPKIKVVDRMLREQEDLPDRVFESHPELLFIGLNGGVIFQSKRTRKGLRHRLELISSEEPAAADFFREIKEEYRRNEVGEEQILNALVMAYGAKASLSRPVKSLPETPVVDSEGLRMAIHYL